MTTATYTRLIECWCGAQFSTIRDLSVHMAHCPPPIPARDRVECTGCGKVMHRHSTIIAHTANGWRCYGCKPAMTRHQGRQLAALHDRPLAMLTIQQKRRERDLWDQHQQWLDEMDDGSVFE